MTSDRIDLRVAGVNGSTTLYVTGEDRVEVSTRGHRAVLLDKAAALELAASLVAHYEVPT